MDPRPPGDSPEAIARLREQFIAILGHDLRGPLSGISMGAEYLLAPSVTLPPEARKVAKRIQSSVKRMKALIDDTLDFARVRLGGSFAVAPSEVHDIGGALEQVISEFEQAYPERRFSVDIDAPTAVHCDRGRLQQLVANLVANALTHGSPTEPVGISAKVTEGSIVLTVRNEGEPIAPARLPGILEPFQRRLGGSGHEYGGLGLGLFICAEIVRAHGGQLEVMSSRETGTTFAARLPIRSSSPS